jgi:hypothetical protein
MSTVTPCGRPIPSSRSLRLDLALVVSAEPLFCLTDLCGLSVDDAINSAEKTGRTLTFATFQQISSVGAASFSGLQAESGRDRVVHRLASGYRRGK